MTRHDLRTRMADYLDDLLAPDEAREVRSEIARHPDLLAEVARMRAVLYRPFPVAPPAPDQRAKILARQRPALRLLRYAAVFAAGVLCATLLRPVEAAPVPSEGPAVQQDPSPAVVVHRRIH